MIVDSSAVITVLGGEPEAETFVEALVRTRRARMSTATFVEAAAVIDRRDVPGLPDRFDELLRTVPVQLVPVEVHHARLARAAYRQFGRGSGHRARLNFGDCFSYALAIHTGEPLLFKGDDFTRTPVVPAVP